MQPETSNASPEYLQRRFEGLVLGVRRGSFGLGEDQPLEIRKRKINAGCIHVGHRGASHFAQGCNHVVAGKTEASFVGRGDSTAKGAAEEGSLYDDSLSHQLALE